MKGDWKLIEWFETGKAELFDPAKDPSEHDALGVQEPEKKAALLADLKAWQRVGAQMMKENPAYDAARENEGPPKEGKGKGKKGKDAEEES